MSQHQCIATKAGGGIHYLQSKTGGNFVEPHCLANTLALASGLQAVMQVGGQKINTGGSGALNRIAQAKTVLIDAQ